MAISVVPVIYDAVTKKIKKWFILDFETQRSDPAFRPQVGEGMIEVPFNVYNQMGRYDGMAKLDELQNYVNSRAP